MSRLEQASRPTAKLLPKSAAAQLLAKCVRPIFTTLVNSLALGRNRIADRPDRPEIKSFFTRAAAAMCIAAGNVSFDDCRHVHVIVRDAQAFFDPNSPPAISIARLEITSFTFMLVCVPEPVCQMRSGNWSSQLAGNHFVRSLHDELRQLRSQFPRSPDSPARKPSSDAKRPNHLRRHSVAPNIEMQQRALRLRSPITLEGTSIFPCCQIRCELLIAGSWIFDCAGGIGMSGTKMEISSCAGTDYYTALLSEKTMPPR